jgi:LysM domain
MSRIEGGAGPVPVGNPGTKSTDSSVATVQVGESKLSDVAQRLSIDAKSLQTANPQISDTAKLKVGQELHLPQFQPSQTQTTDDGANLQSEVSQSGPPRLPMGDPLAKNAMQARLSANDLSQVPGGVQQTNSQHLKFVDKGFPSTTLSNPDKWYKADQAPEPLKGIGQEKAFQKADDLAQIAGGAGYVNFQQMKESGKATKLVDADKAIHSDKMLKMDKSTDPERIFIKGETTESTLDIAVNKAKTANKSFTKMDGYIRQ